jgi:hypothetical protein
MHTLIKDIDVWNVVFDGGAGAPYILATIADVHQAVKLVNYLNGGDGKESGFPFQHLDQEARLYQATTFAVVIVPTPADASSTPAGGGGEMVMRK